MKGGRPFVGVRRAGGRPPGPRPARCRPARRRESSGRSGRPGGAPASAARSAPASDASRRVSPEGSRSEPSARPSARVAASSSSARVSRRLAAGAARRILQHPGDDGRRLPGPGPQHRTGRGGTAEPGLEPDQGLARQMRSCPPRASLAMASRPATSPSGTASRASPARSRCRSGGPAVPARSAAQSRMVSVSASPASVRRSATRVLATGSAVQARTLVGVDDGIGQAEMRGGHRGQGVVAGQHAAGAGGHPAGGAAISRPIAISRSSAAAVRAGSTPVAAKRCLTASQGSGVRSRCHSRWLRTPGAEIVVLAVGQDDEPLPVDPVEQRLADGQRRHARDDPDRHVAVGELRRPRPLRDAPGRRGLRRRSSCGAPGRAAPAGRAAWPGSRSRSLLHPPLHDHLLVAVRLEERRQRPEHLAGRGALDPAGPAPPAGRRQR